MHELKVTSQAFKHNEQVPAKYTCDSENISPPLKIENIPKNVRSLVIIVDDPDAPLKIWVHWVVWNILPNIETIGENTAPGIEGINDYKRNIYRGPCPPFGTHRYFFKIYALDTMLDIPKTSTKADVEKAMQNHIIAKGELMGLYSR